MIRALKKSVGASRNALNSSLNHKTVVRTCEPVHDDVRVPATIRALEKYVEAPCDTLDSSLIHRKAVRAWTSGKIAMHVAGARKGPRTTSRPPTHQRKQPVLLYKFGG